MNLSELNSNEMRPVQKIDLSHQQNATLGFYFHFPFCPHLCPYCDFIKTDRFSRRDVVVHQSWMLEELEKILESHDLSQHSTVTVYFGGGTPGLFWGSTFRPFIERISSRWRIEECTLEANPNMISESKILSWKQAGIDRLTLGVQSLDEAVLSFLGRRHSSKQALSALISARKAGFEQVQVDLIYGLPKEFSSRQINDEINLLVREGATGVSLYALTVEPQTEFGVLSVEPDDEAAASDYRIIVDMCAQLGLLQRETSNFSLFESKHNNLYWHGHPYFGIGAGAHGLLEPDSGRPFGQRYRFGPAVDDVDRTQVRPGRDDLRIQDSQSTYRQCHFEPPRSWSDLFNELSFSLLRTPLGIPKNWMDAFGDKVDWSALQRDALIRKGFEQGCLVMREDGGFYLSPDDLIRGDLWHSRIVDVLGTLS